MALVLLHGISHGNSLALQSSWVPSDVGYLRGDPKVYECPVFATSSRGTTYTFLSTLRTRDESSKWILAGTALVMSTDD